MSGHLDVLLGGAVVVIVLMIGTWLVSIALHDAGVVDIVWGVGLAVVALTARAIGDGNDARADLLTALVLISGLRLSVFLWWRGRGTDEPVRYRSLRSRTGEIFAMKSLVTVFLFRGALMWAVALPVLLAVTAPGPELGAFAIVGVVVWGIGFFFETVGDAQLARFRSDPANDGRIMDMGLWRITRHPNYFGDFCVWWGIWIVAAETSDARFGVVGPLLMTLMLLGVSGIRMLEHGLRESRTGYDDYASRTATFFPRRPKPTS